MKKYFDLNNSSLIINKIDLVEKEKIQKTEFFVILMLILSILLIIYAKF